MRRVLICGFAVALGACARGDDADPAVAATFGPGVGEAGDDSGVTPAATSSAQSDTDTEADADASTGTTGGDDTGALTSADASSGDAAESSTGVAPAECVPEPQPDDNECFVCARVVCCEEVSACADSAMCTCALDCLADGWDPETCVVGCGIDGAVSNLVLCGATQCEQPCNDAL